MKYIPAISIKGGHVAIAEKGAYSFLRNENGQFRNPINLIKEMDFSEEEIFILDIDGLERNSPDLDTVKHMATFRDIWLDAGTPDYESMMDLFISGASRVVLSTLSVISLEELRKALDMSENIIFSIAYDGSVVSSYPAIAGMSLDALMIELKEINKLKLGMLFDLGSLRDRIPPDIDTITRIAPFFDEFYVSGYLTEKEADALANSGVTGLIIDYRTLGGMHNDRA